MSDCARLAGSSAAVHVRIHIKLIDGVSRFKRPSYYHVESFAGKIRVEIFPVDRIFPRSTFQPYPGERAFAPAGSNKDFFLTQFKNPPRFCLSASCLDFQRLRFLCRMRVFRACIYPEFPGHCSAKTITRKHSLDSQRDNAFRKFFL